MNVSHDKMRTAMRQGAEELWRSHMRGVIVLTYADQVDSIEYADADDIAMAICPAAKLGALFDRHGDQAFEEGCAGVREAVARYDPESEFIALIPDDESQGIWRTFVGRISEPSYC